MKYWEKVFRRATEVDKNRLAKLIVRLEKREFPPNTIKLTDQNSYRVRTGDWRIQFHYDGDIVIIDDIGRRNENTYK